MDSYARTVVCAPSDSAVGCAAAEGGGPEPARMPHCCGTCGATFATRPQLDAHLERAYHGFQCLACGAVCATAPAFDEHIGRQHG